MNCRREVGWFTGTVLCDVVIEIPERRACRNGVPNYDPKHLFRRALYALRLSNGLMQTNPVYNSSPLVACVEAAVWQSCVAKGSA